MGITLQHLEAEIPELVGATCERFLCLQFRQTDGSMNPGILWLKIRGGAWHRFFIDAWLLFWHERDDFEDESDEPDVFLDDLGRRHALEGVEIASIAMRQTPDDEEFDSCLTISFADGRAFVLRHSEGYGRCKVMLAADA